MLKVKQFSDIFYSKIQLAFSKQFVQKLFFYSSEQIILVWQKTEMSPLLFKTQKVQYISYLSGNCLGKLKHCNLKWSLE